MNERDRPLRRELEVAESAVRRAGALLLEHFAATKTAVEEKAPLDVVTPADREAEQPIREVLQAEFPGDAVVGEEGGETCLAAGRVWYVDPLDGTFNFSRRIPFWCCSIGLVDGGGRALGVVFDPLEGEIFVGLRGKGAFLNGRSLQVSTVKEPMDAVVQVTVDFRRDAIDRSLQDVASVARGVMRVRNLGALALELCYVACGRLDGVVQRGSHAWDYAAAILIAEEAGAVTSDLDGSPFDLFTPDAVTAATLELHEALVRMVAEGT